MEEHDMGRLGRIRGALEALACRTGERVIPKYQHVIDPNLCVRQGRWVACSARCNGKWHTPSRSPEGRPRSGSGSPTLSWISGTGSREGVCRSTRQP
eukprot:TRINITY_DN13729_c0_g2_i1.p3 TRINITY_DN13729_c0_g2~~TRINITY_DN13729_c0_g2_i1.p3  ORF type:complete len:109 (+),score=15.09 TRINITY_DN13729_c0_g2_i1:38-328(+)